jgi:hypothetical protein
MSFCYFVTLENSSGAALGEADRTAIAKLVAATPGLSYADLHTPTVTRDLYTEDGSSPPLALQLYFEALPALEAAIAAQGHLQPLAGAWPSLAGARATQQVMYARQFPVDDGGSRERRCSFLVHYPGPAADLNRWLNHYIAGHPPIMRRFPGIRQIEILTRVDWIDAMPFARVEHMQRNRVVFDTPEALTAALQSPVRHELRADFHRFPSFEGGSFHFPMISETIRKG